MIRFLLDMGLPRRAAIRLREASWDVVHVAEQGLARAADAAILAAAEQDGRVVVTLDGDFATLVATGALRGPSVIHIRLDHVTWDVVVRVLLLERDPGRVPLPPRAECRRAKPAWHSRDVLGKAEEDLAAGCIVSVGAAGCRVRRLPVR